MPAQRALSCRRTTDDEGAADISPPSAAVTGSSPRPMRRFIGILNGRSRSGSRQRRRITEAWTIVNEIVAPKA